MVNVGIHQYPLSLFLSHPNCIVDGPNCKNEGKLYHRYHCIYNNDYDLCKTCFNKYKINHHFNLNEIYLLNDEIKWTVYITTTQIIFIILPGYYNQYKNIHQKIQHSSICISRIYDLSSGQHLLDYEKNYYNLDSLDNKYISPYITYDIYNDKIWLIKPQQLNNPNQYQIRIYNNHHLSQSPQQQQQQAEDQQPVHKKLINNFISKFCDNLQRILVHQSLSHGYIPSLYNLLKDKAIKESTNKNFKSRNNTT